MQLTNECKLGPMDRVLCKDGEPPGPKHSILCSRVTQEVRLLYWGAWL